MREKTSLLPQQRSPSLLKNKWDHDWRGSVGWALSHRAKNVPGLTRGQGICLCCRFGPLPGSTQETIDGCFSPTSVCLSLSFSSTSPFYRSISQSINEKIEGEQKTTWYLSVKSVNLSSRRKERGSK